MSNNNTETGFFRCKKGYTVVQNEITRDSSISLKAKGLYLVIQSSITNPNVKYSKTDFMEMTKEGEKAFDAAWKELKENGYLKVHNKPNGNKFVVEFELLDEPVLGPHTFYYNKDGEVTRTNETSRTPHLGVPAKGVSAEGSTVEGSTATGTTANGGDKIINTNSNPVINPYITPSFILSTTVNCEGRMEGKNSAVIIYPEDELSEEEIMAVWDEVESGIPAELAYDMPKMTKVIQCLADWNNRKTLTSDASMEKIYLQVVECLVEMVTDKNVQIYKNTKVTYKNVIDQINKECGQTIPGALQSFVIGMCNRIKIAFNTKTVKNPKAYIKSMIWEQFSVYGMIQVIDV